MIHHPVNFVIICSGRTGSTWLSSSLNTHSMIHCGGELHRIFRQTPNDYKRLLVSPGPYGIQMPYRGFKLMYHILERVDSYILDIVDEFDPVVIFLYRKNIFEQFLSDRLACRSRCFIITRESTSISKFFDYNRPIFLEIDEFKCFRDSQYHWRASLEKRYPDAITLWYEDLKQDGIEPIVEKFGLRVENFPPTTLILRRKTKKELIINYDEMLEYLKSVGDEWQLEDPEPTMQDFNLRAVFRENQAEQEEDHNSVSK